MEFNLVNLFTLETNEEGKRIRPMSNKVRKDQDVNVPERPRLQKRFLQMGLLKTCSFEKVSRHVFIASLQLVWKCGASHGCPHRHIYFQRSKTRVQLGYRSNYRYANYFKATPLIVKIIKYQFNTSIIRYMHYNNQNGCKRLTKMIFVMTLKT